MIGFALQNVIIIISLSTMMEVYRTPSLQRSSRSMSYNDLKKRRLLRSSSSHRKLQNTEQQTPRYIKTEAKNRDGESGRKEGVRKHEHQSGKVGRKGRTLVERSDRSKWNQVEEGASTKEIIRKILQKNKTKSKLSRVEQIRKQFKEHKERSRSRSPQQQLSTIKRIPSAMKEQLKTTAEPKIPVLAVTDKQPLKNNQEEAQPVPNIEDISAIGGKTEEKPEESVIDVMASAGWTCTEKGSFLRLLDRPTQRASKSRDMERIKRIFPKGFFA